MSHLCISQKIKGVLIVKSSTHYFHMKTKILAEFQICINVPLKSSKSHFHLSLVGYVRNALFV